MQDVLVWRSKLYTWKFMVQSTSSCFGPLISVLLFVFLGNKWVVRPKHPHPPTTMSVHVKSWKRPDHVGSRESDQGLESAMRVSIVPVT